GRFRDPLARLARLRSDLRLLPAPADRAPSARGRGGRGRGRRGAGPHGRGSCRAARADAAGCAVADLATAVVCLGAGGPDPPARRRARLAPIPPRGRGGGGRRAILRELERARRADEGSWPEAVPRLLHRHLSAVLGRETAGLPRRDLEALLAEAGASREAIAGL